MTGPTRPIVPEPPIVDVPPAMPKGAIVFPPGTIVTDPPISRPIHIPGTPDTPPTFGVDEAAAYFAEACNANSDIPPDAFTKDQYRVIQWPSGHVVVARHIGDVVDAYNATIAAENAGGDVPIEPIAEVPLGAPLPANNG